MTKKLIDEKDIANAARLARLSFSQEELKNYSEKLSVILDYIDKLNKLPTDDVEPTSHVVSGIKNVFREDNIIGSYPIEDVLNNTPKRIKNFFGVPKIIE